MRKFLSLAVCFEGVAAVKKSVMKFFWPDFPLCVWLYTFGFSFPLMITNTQMSMLMLELFIMASWRKNWKRISAESSYFPPEDPANQGTELNLNMQQQHLFTCSRCMLSLSFLYFCVSQYLSVSFSECSYSCICTDQHAVSASSSARTLINWLVIGTLTPKVGSL